MTNSVKLFSSYPSIDPRGVVVIDILNPSMTHMVVIHPDGRFEGGPAATVLSPSMERMFCAGASRSDGTQRIRFESPDMEEVLKTAPLMDSVEIRKLLGEFPEFQKLRGSEQSWLVALWQGNSREVPFPGKGESENSFRRRLGMIYLSHRFRTSLAGEQSFRVAWEEGREISIRFRFIEKKLPIRDGTIPVNLAKIDKLLVHFDRPVPVLDPEERNVLREALVKIEALKIYWERSGEQPAPTRMEIAERFLPTLERNLKQHLLFAVIVLDSPRGEVNERLRRLHRGE